MITFKVSKITTPHTVVDTISGTYAVVNSKWYSVPLGTKRSDIEVIEENPTPPKLITTKLSRLEFVHQSNKGLETYNVIRKKDGMWSCNCIGFGVYKKCKHVDLYKKKIEEVEI